MTEHSMSFMEALEILDEYGYKYGSTTREAIASAVADAEWQDERRKLKGWPTRDKIEFLGEWYVLKVRDEPKDTHKWWVQVTNYLNALKRGGQLK